VAMGWVGASCAEGARVACEAVLRAACKKAVECRVSEFEDMEACILQSAQTQCPEAEIRAAEEACKAQGWKVDLSALERCEANYNKATCIEHEQGIACDFSIRCKS